MTTTNKQLDYKLGDIVLIRIDEHHNIRTAHKLTVPAYRCQIIAIYDSDNGCYDDSVMISVIDPSYYFMKGGYIEKLSIINYQNLYVPDKHVVSIANITTYDGTPCAWIFPKEIVEIVKEETQSNCRDPETDFCTCKVCKIPYPMAEPNQEDGTLICWSCRNYPLRAYY